MALPCPWTCHHLSSHSGSVSRDVSRVGFRSHWLWYGFHSQGFYRGVGAVPGQHFMIFLTFLLALQVRTHGTSGSSVLSEESWLGSMGCGLLTLAGSVVCFSSIHWLFLAGPSYFSTALFLLAYCLPPTLCSLFLGIAHWTALNDRPHFLATSLMFLALLTM